MRIEARLAIGIGLVALGCAAEACGSSGGPPGVGGPSTAGGSSGAGGSSSSSGAVGSDAAGAAPTSDAAGGTMTAEASSGATEAGDASGTSTPIADASDAGSPIADASAADAQTGDASPIVTPPFTASYHMGADISWVPHDEFYGATYVDTDGVQKDILALLKNHGFNSVRLRTFVDPKAIDGYDQVNGFADLAHTVSMAQRIRAAGMGFLLAFHYSDNWADPGKQCIPVAWQQDATVAALAQHLHDYTFSVISALKSAGAAPELVQIGNEITPGMLIHICNTLGLPTSTNAVNGSAANWANLGTLLKAGIQGVKDVDANIKTVLHIDKGGDLAASRAWITNARAQAVPFDVFADTSYVRYQGQPSGWQNTFNMLATAFPTLSFIIPEYGNETATSPATPSTMRLANDYIFSLPGNRGLGTWIYEPEHPVMAGVGIGLFTRAFISADAGTDAGTFSDPWPTFRASQDMAVYDQMKAAYTSRL
jgi:arabinogalactan endo-1,4-beta-galactosidase